MRGMNILEIVLVSKLITSKSEIRRVIKNKGIRINNKLIEVISNYVPDIIILGHADLIKKETLNFFASSGYILSNSFLYF